MTSQQAVDIATQALIVTAKLAGPFLAVLLAIGVVVGILQSVTQLQEQTLSFVPKLLGAAVVIALAGSWMLDELVAFSRELLVRAPDYLNG